MIKLALSGPIASGKTSVAQYLSVKHHLYRCSFGTHMKTSMMHIWDSAVLDKNRYRERQQLFGEAVRAIDPDVWVRGLVENWLFKYVLDGESDLRGIIVDDVRNLDEYLALKERGFVMAQLRVSEQEQLRRVSYIYPDMGLKLLKHMTEEDIEADYDYVVDTNTSFKETCTRVEQILLEAEEE